MWGGARLEFKESMKKGAYVAISGNIGSGKTTLCRYIQEVLSQATVMYEQFEENEYLSSFYDHLKANGIQYNPFSYPTQLKFLQVRANQEVAAFAKHLQSAKDAEGDNHFVVDRSIYEDCAVFAKSHEQSGLMSQEEFKKYLSFFNQCTETMRVPDLVIYLKIDPKKLYERIQSRGREMEKDISEDYLRGLQSLYEQFINNMKSKGVEVLEISTETRDDYPIVIDKILTMNLSTSN